MKKKKVLWSRHQGEDVRVLGQDFLPVDRDGQLHQPVAKLVEKGTKLFFLCHRRKG
jgi:hypothetical protein